SATAVPGDDPSAGEVPGSDVSRARRSVPAIRRAQRHLAVAGKRPDVGDRAKGGPLGPPRCGRPGHEADGRLADTRVMRAGSEGRATGWRGGEDVCGLAGRPIRLRFVLTD